MPWWSDVLRLCVTRLYKEVPRPRNDYQRSHTDIMATHSTQGTQDGAGTRGRFIEVDRKEGFGGLFQQVDLQPRKVYGGLEEYLNALTEHLRALMEPMLKEKGGINFWLSVQVAYTRAHGQAPLPRSIYLHTGKLVIFQCTLETQLKYAMNIILQRNATTLREKSGLIIDSIHKTRFKIVDYLPWGIPKGRVIDDASDDDDD